MNPPPRKRVKRWIEPAQTGYPGIAVGVLTCGHSVARRHGDKRTKTAGCVMCQAKAAPGERKRMMLRRLDDARLKS